MMTLIIFLIFFTVLFFIFVLLKIKANLLIKLNGSTINARLRILKHDFNFSHDLRDLQALKNSHDFGCANNLQTKSKMRNNKIQLREVKDIISLASISETEVKITVGTPLINLTLLFVVILSALIPTMHKRYFDGNGSIKYKVIPDYKNFKLDGTIKIDFCITPLELFLAWRKF